MNRATMTRQDNEEVPSSSAPPDVLQDPMSFQYKPVRREVEQGERPKDTAQQTETEEAPNPLTMGLQMAMRGLQRAPLDDTTKEEKTKPRYQSGGTENNINLKQGTGDGSGLVVNAMDSGEFALDEISMTSRYLNELRQSPNLSEEELWRRAIKNDANKSGQLTTVQEAPEPAPLYDESMIPKTDGNSIYAIDPLLYTPPSTRRAIVIGNHKYTDPDIDDLPGAERDAGAMASRYSALGYDVEHLKDQSSTGMLKAVFKAGDGLKEGDSLVFYYAGHGIDTGLLGTNATLKNMKVLGHGITNSLVTDAVAGGYHASVIADACESGAMTDRLKDEYKEETQSSSSSSLMIDFDNVNKKDYVKFDNKGKKASTYSDSVIENLYDKRFSR
ncbi:MAG: caspase family protein [Myxococcota bacterium]